MKKGPTSLIFLIFIAALVSCSKDEPMPKVTDPQKALIGKWEVAKTGSSMNNLENVVPTGYTEYINDSTYRFYDYETHYFSYGDYLLNDSMLLYFHYDIEDGEIIDTLALRYYYHFENRKTLVLDWDAFAILDISVHRKIN